MRCTFFVPVCAFALFGVACEKHPLPGEPPMTHVERVSSGGNSPAKVEEHSGGKAPAPGEARDDAAQPAAKRSEGEGAKPAEPPKFFPEKK